MPVLASPRKRPHKGPDEESEWGWGVGSRLEMELANVKHMLPRKQNVVEVSRAWEVGLHLTRT